MPNFMKIEKGPDFFLLIWYGMTLQLLGILYFCPDTMLERENCSVPDPPLERFYLFIKALQHKC